MNAKENVWRGSSCSTHGGRIFEARLIDRLKKKASVCRRLAGGANVVASDYPEHQSSQSDLIDWLTPDTSVTPDVEVALTTLADCFDTTADGIEVLRRVVRVGRRKSVLELIAEAQNMLQSALRDAQSAVGVEPRRFHDADLSRVYKLVRGQAKAGGWRMNGLNGGHLKPSRISEVADDLRKLAMSP